MTACSAGDCLGVGRGRIFTRSLARSRYSFIDVRSLILSIVGRGDVIECCTSMLDRTGGLGIGAVVIYYEGGP